MKGGARQRERGDGRSAGRGRRAPHTGLDLLVDDPTTRWCAAIGAAHLLWRDGPLEDIHAGVNKAGGIADLDMNARQRHHTRHIAGALTTDGCDWGQLAAGLTHADRPIGEVALSAFVGVANLPRLRRHALDAANHLEALARNGWEWLRTCLACSGSMRDWFGVPWWPAHVAAFLTQVIHADRAVTGGRRARPAPLPEPPLGLAQVATGLLRAPEQLSTEVLTCCVHDAGLGGVDRQAVTRAWRAAGRCRWAPVPR